MRNRPRNHTVCTVHTVLYAFYGYSDSSSVQFRMAFRNELHFHDLIIPESSSLTHHSSPQAPRTPPAFPSITSQHTPTPPPYILIQLPLACFAPKWGLLRWEPPSVAAHGVLSGS
eukprot:COSAG02_NODE_3104_length_7366_cov_7.224302_2_plen_115_part_00